MILIVTRKDDVHADIVTAELDKLGATFFRLNTEAVNEYDIILSLDGATIIHRSTRRIVRSDDVRSVYLRRRSLPEFDIDLPYVGFVQSEWKLFLRNLWTLHTNAFWISHPDAIERASDKMLQLRASRDLGFAIPETIMTNSHDAVKRLYERQSNLIYKAFNSGEINRKSGEVIYTSALDKHLISDEHADEFQICPGIYQPRIDKAYEVRVTVIGSAVFAARIASQESSRTSLDWRRYEDGNILHEAYELEPPVARRCVALVQQFGLEFGAIDLIKSDAGYTFLEINSNGQWAWIEACTKYPMARTMAELLLRRVADASD